ARAYFDLRGLQERLLVAQRNAENQQRSLALTRDLLDAGRGTALDTERAQAQLSSTLADIPALEAAVAGARNRIAVLLGVAPGGVPPVADDATLHFTMPEQLAVADADQAVLRRPD